MLQPINAYNNTLPLNAGASSFSIHTLDWLIQQGQHYATRLKTYELFWIRKGQATLTADLRDLELQENKVYLLRPGQFRHLEPSQELDGYYLSISAEFFHLSGVETGSGFLPANLQAFEGAVVIPTDEEIQREAEEVLVKMRREFMQYATTRTHLLKGLFKLFMLYLSQSTADVTPAAGGYSEKELTNKFLQLLQKNFTTRKFVSDYADELFVTPGHLNRIVKKISGFPARHHIQQQVILEAKKQARYSNRSMKEIAYSLGFEDTAHFSKYFKNSSGMNFSNFKRLTD